MTVYFTFEQAFAAWKMHSYKWSLKPGDPRDHECGWMVRPIRTELPGGHIIYACHGCGDCFTDNDSSGELIAA